MLKLGGELLEDAAAMKRRRQAVTALAEHGPLVIVHGGGRAIDAELRARGHEPPLRRRPPCHGCCRARRGRMRARGTEQHRTRRRASAQPAERAIGLTGADAVHRPVDPCWRLSLAVSGERVDLGLVGQPGVKLTFRLLQDLLALGYIPVIASVGVSVHRRSP